jgi:hypothetical protein
MDDKITIIEGPPPVFESVNDGWAIGLNEGPYLFDVAVTRLRTFNGPALVERCYRAWHNHRPIHLEYRDNDGLENQAPILAARSLEIDDGQMLLLWVRMETQEGELEIGYDYDDDSLDLGDTDSDDPDSPF